MLPRDRVQLLRVVQYALTVAPEPKFLHGETAVQQPQRRITRGHPPAALGVGAQTPAPLLRILQPRPHLRVGLLLPGLGRTLFSLPRDRHLAHLERQSGELRVLGPAVGVVVEDYLPLVVKHELAHLVPLLQREREVVDVEVEHLLVRPVAKVERVVPHLFVALPPDARVVHVRHVRVVRELVQPVLDLRGQVASRYHVLAADPQPLGVVVRFGRVLHGEHPDAVDVTAGGAAEELVVTVGVEEVAGEVVAVVLVATAVRVETPGGHPVRLARAEFLPKMGVKVTPPGCALELLSLALDIVAIHRVTVREVAPRLGRVPDAEVSPHDFSPHALRSGLPPHLTRDGHHPHDVDDVETRPQDLVEDILGQVIEQHPPLTVASGGRRVSPSTLPHIGKRQPQLPRKKSQSVAARAAAMHTGTLCVFGEYKPAPPGYAKARY